MDRPNRARPLPCLVTALTLCGCGAGHDTPGGKPRPVASPAIVPMSEADVRRSAITCLQRPPYPVDGGPRCLRPDGTWITYGGWGNPVGRYRITGNTIIFGESRPPDAVSLFRGRGGRMFLRHDEEGSERRLYPFRPYPEAEYLRSLGPPVPPPPDRPQP